MDGWMNGRVRDDCAHCHVTVVEVTGPDGGRVLEMHSSVIKNAAFKLPSKTGCITREPLCLAGAFLCKFFEIPQSILKDPEKH